MLKELPIRSGLKTSYDALSTKDARTLYITTDVPGIYLGTILLTQDPQLVTQIQQMMQDIEELQGDLQDHIEDMIHHITDTERNLWNSFESRIDGLENLGSFVGTFQTFAQVPTNVSGFEFGITVNDFINVRVDETRDGAHTRYIAIDIDNYGDITWVYDVTYSTDITGKMDLQPSATTGNIAIFNNTGQVIGSDTAINDLAEEFSLANTNSIELEMDENREIIANARISQQSNNQLSELSDGLFVSVSPKPIPAGEIVVGTGLDITTSGKTIVNTLDTTLALNVPTVGAVIDALVIGTF
ncbi:MAG: hypothetical protein FWC41_00255 [Firmicutes bacterium]|nr:hypothetical protein [Bacillota bacterium]